MKITKLLSLCLVLLVLVSLSSCKKNKEKTPNTDNENNSNIHTCSWSVDSVLTEQSCTQDGFALYSCSCGETKLERKDATGHSFTDWQEISPATCASAGSEKRTCEICSETETRSTDRLTHKYASTEETVNGVLTTTYLCDLCSDTFSIATTLVENFEGMSARRISNCASDFSFYLVCGQDDEYIRNNLRIFDAYYEGSEYENHEEVVCSYTLTETEENIWLVTPSRQYEPGNTYKAVRSGDVVFRDYGIYDLTFSIFKEQTEIIEVNDSLIFIQNLENKNPGYYPYTIEYSENSDTHWLTLKKVDGLKVGDVVCVGSAKNIDEVFGNYNDENTFGKISTITYVQSKSHYLISLVTPEMSEIFDEIDIYTSNMEQAGEIKTSDDSTVDSVVKALMNDEDFINFAASSYVTTLEYLGDKGLTTSVASFKDFLESIKIDETQTYGPEFDEDSDTITANIVINGSISIPVEMGNNNIGNISIGFEAGVKLDYLKILINHGGKKELENSEKKKITKLEVLATQSVTTSFSFNVEMRIDYSMEATPYVLNTSTGVYHYASCKHVSSIKSPQYISAKDLFNKIANGEIGASKECGTCKPIAAMKSDNYILNTQTKTIHVFNCSSLKNASSSNLAITSSDIDHLKGSSYSTCNKCHPESVINNSFSESLIENIKYKNFGQNIDEIKDVADKINNSETDKKIPIGSPLNIDIYCFRLQFRVYSYVDFSLEASVEYRYEQTVVSEYGVKLTSKGVVPIKNTPEVTIKENCLTAIGKARLDVGIWGEAKLTFPGLERKLYVSLNAKVGLYAEVHGALRFDFVNPQTNYMVAYFESGLHCEVYVAVRIPIIQKNEKNLDIWDKDFPLVQKGYGVVIFDYVYYPEEIVIDSEKFSLNHDAIVTVRGMDLIDMDNVTQKFSPLGMSGRYDVNFSLKSGDNCYIESGYLYVKDPSKSFTDELTVTVTCYDTWNNYKSANTLVMLPARTIKIVYKDAKYSSGLKYELNADGASYSVIGRGSCTDTKIVIPDTYNNKPVLAIGNEAFCDSSISSVVIPASVKIINREAFSNCYALEKVEFGLNSQLEEIGQRAFYQCSALYDFKLPESVREISNNILTGCDLILYNEQGDYYIGSANNPYFALVEVTDTTNTEYKVNKQTVVIAGGTFYQCTQLTKIILPASVVGLSGSAFRNCTSLTNIYVDSSNTTYKTIDGNVYSKDGKIFVRYAPGNTSSSFTVPSGVTSIGYRAFANCEALVKVELPKGLKIIGNSAFNSCKSLSEINIPEGITEIGGNAFAHCSSLENIELPDGISVINVATFYGTALRSIVIPKSVKGIYSTAFANIGWFHLYYTGTESDWASITIYNGNLDDGFTIHFNHNS